MGAQGTGNSCNSLEVELTHLLIFAFQPW